MTADIHTCRPDEIASVMCFLDEHWSRGHILSHHQPLMDWQHRERDGSGNYCYVVARESGGGDLLAVLGFIPSRLYDPDLADRSTVWMALWKVRPDHAAGGLGLMTLRHLTATERHEAIGANGIGEDSHFPMYRALGFVTGTYTQALMLNPDKPDQRLVALPSGFRPTRPRSGKATLRKLVRETFFESTGRIALGSRAAMLPTKTPRYFHDRYLIHPIYQYAVHRVELDGRAVGLLASRVAEHGGARALRLVDFLGDATVLAELGPALRTLVGRCDAEYADIWAYGVDPEILAAAGFDLVEPEGPVVVPAFFEPYERRNSRIRFAYKAPAGTAFVLFKADGDQDRPNRAPIPPQESELGQTHA